jgi:undecaprenyl-diphosphatase
MEFLNHILEIPPDTLHNWGYLILLAATLCETTPLFGILIPGQTLVIASGIFVKMGILHFLPLILIISCGAILGDTFGYFLGRKYGHDLLLKYGKYFLLKPERFKKAQALIDNNVGKTLVLGRLNSFTRATVPLVTGASKVSFRKFFTFNILGGFLWAITFVGMGYVFGTSYELAAKYVGKFIFFAIVGTIAIIWGYKFVEKRRHIFDKYHLYALSLCIISLWMFFKMAEDVYTHDFVLQIDSWLNAQVITIWNPVLNQIVIFITNIGGIINLAVLSVALFIALILTKKWYNSILLFCSMIGGVIGNELLKNMVQRSRPSNSLIAVDDFSFPSGHSMMSIIFFSLLLYSFKDDIKKPLLKKLFIFGNIFLFILIGFSRIYLNVHWFSDVVAGFSLGLFWLTLLILVFKATIFFVRSYKNRLSRAK